MKKIIPLLLTIALVFVSCEIEPLGNDGLNGVEGKGSSLSDQDCYVNLTPTLPELVRACTTAKPGTESYFLVDIASGDLAGVDIPTWCVDVDKTLGVECFDAKVYSSYGSFPLDEFENPGNFDLVNWILNQNFISQGYTFGHIQWAIWELIDDKNCVSCSFLTNPRDNWLITDPNDVVKGQEIVDAAKAAGDGFEPGAGQNLAIILIPTDDTKQSIIIPYPLECEPEIPCEPCDGKVTKLTLQNNGSDALIRVAQKKDDVTVFEDNVTSGASFSFSGTDKNGTLGTEIIIYVDGVEHARIHTSCSQPIGPGLISGILMFLDGKSQISITKYL